MANHIIYDTNPLVSMANITNHTYFSTKPVCGFKMIFDTETQTFDSQLIGVGIEVTHEVKRDVVTL